TGPVAQASAVAVLGGLALAVDSDAGPAVFGGLASLGAKATIYTNTTTTKGLVIQGTSGQTANLQEWQDRAANVLASLGPAGAITGSMDTMTFAATITLDITKGTLHKLTTLDTTPSATINASAPGTAGQEMTLLVLNDLASGKTIAFGSNFKAAGSFT